MAVLRRNLVREFSFFFFFDAASTDLANRPRMDYLTESGLTVTVTRLPTLDLKQLTRRSPWKAL